MAGRRTFRILTYSQLSGISSFRKADCSKFDVDEEFYVSVNGTNYRNNVLQTEQESITQIMFRGKFGV
jgi:uncharacterized protein YgiB involved in biofilm formation